MSGSTGRVPLARRNLFADRRRLLASVLGVGLAVMLILLLDGLWSGIQQQTTVYTDNVGGDLYVLQPGVRDLTAGASALPLTTVDQVRADPGVAWAAPVRSAYVILQLHNQKIAAYVIGSVPGRAAARGRSVPAVPHPPMTRSWSGRSSPTGTASRSVTGSTSPDMSSGSSGSPTPTGS